eukprot:184515-Pyramimonas_sp.AAC.1
MSSESPENPSTPESASPFTAQSPKQASESKETLAPVPATGTESAQKVKDLLESFAPESDASPASWFEPSNDSPQHEDQYVDSPSAREQPEESTPQQDTGAEKLLFLPFSCV